MKRCIVFLGIALAAAGADRAEFTLGGVDGNAWQVPLAAEGEEDGFYSVFNSEGELIERIAVGTSPQWVGADTLLDYAYLPGSMRPTWVDPNLNLTPIVSWDQNGQSQVPFHDLGGNIRVTQGENSAFMGMTLPSVMLAYDGDRKTAMFRVFRQQPGSTPGIGRGFRNNTITNFGAEMPINRIPGPEYS